MIKEKDMANITILEEDFMKENGSMINRMGTALKNGVMAADTKVIL